jgi:shikimate dehydrogenase
VATLNITGTTRVFAILAHPTDHVRTPQVFNAAYERLGIDAVLVPLDVAP